MHLTEPLRGSLPELPQAQCVGCRKGRGQGAGGRAPDKVSQQALGSRITSPRGGLLEVWSRASGVMLLRQTVVSICATETSFDPICSQLASFTQMYSPRNQGSRYKTHHTTTASTQTDPSCRTRWAGRPSSVSLPYSSLVLLLAARALAPYLRMEIQVPMSN